MTPLELLRSAATALAAQRGRSMLTVLSITIGAFAIVVMSSLAASGLTTIQRAMTELGGARLIFVLPKAPERGEAKAPLYPRGMTLVDRDRIFRELPHVEQLTIFSRLRKRDVVTEAGTRTVTDFVAADARFLEFFRMKLARGRGFTEDENRARASVCVIGKKLEAKLSPQIVLGGLVTIGRLRCRVIGVLADNERFGMGLGFDWNDLAVAPSEAVADLDVAVRERASVLVRTESEDANDIVKRILNARMSARHPGVDDFFFIDFSGFMGRFQTMFIILEAIVAALAAIALVIGGVGVMNMMLVCVSERAGEIGLRKALGAPPSTIRAQFLVEAILLALVGGGSGVLGGLAIASAAGFAITKAIPSWQLSLAPVAAWAALFVSVAVGALFGWLPARRAARLAPVVALRSR